ncbi:cobalamin biosynthesis protein [Streptomyces sp. TLI_053]|uniref:cobalamin biosynthesis protein n=1 Tax=Streptomyces sp. TLI_053 TaxID=1855352 RepID=UPI000B808B74|nr:cobalamin biosynthesis protein [Streptomyces sp. TLI_053]
MRGTGRAPDDGGSVDDAGPVVGAGVVGEHVVDEHLVGEHVADGPGLVVGVGVRATATRSELLELIRHTLAGAGLPADTVRALATLAGKGGHPAVRTAAAALGVPVAEYPAEALAAVRVPNPSGTVGAAVGTVSVAEAAALAATGGGELLVAKRKTASATAAVARTPHPRNAGEQP